MNPIKKARLLKEMTQGDLAKALGVTSGAVSQWEKGNTIPSPRRLVKMANILGISIEELLNSKKAG